MWRVFLNTLRHTPPRRQKPSAVRAGRRKCQEPATPARARLLALAGVAGSLSSPDLPPCRPTFSRPRLSVATAEPRDPRTPTRLQTCSSLSSPYEQRPRQWREAHIRRAATSRIVCPDRGHYPVT